VDAILGTANADLFQAMVLANTNSLQSGDVIDGGLGVDTLTAYMGNSATFATIATTRNIENIDIQAQATPVDATNGNNLGNNGTSAGTGVATNGQNTTNLNNSVTIDAQLMSGVSKWASVDSRADVIVEDVRINSNVSTIEFKQSDPGNVDFGVYFNQRNLVNTTGGSSNLNIFLMDTAAANAAATAATPLLNHNFDSFSFYANGALVTLGGAGTAAGAAINAATTYAALLAAFQSALTTASVGGVVTNLSGTTTASLSAAQNLTTAAALDPVSAPVAASFLNLTGQILVLTATGTNTITGTGVGTGWAASGVAPGTGAIVQTYNSGATSTSALVNTNIILDDVGMGSTGGDLVVGGMSVGATSASQGVERFNIEVRDNSKLQTINSTNDTLREVVIVNGATTSTSTAYVTTTANAGSLTVLGNANAINPVSGQTTAQAGSDLALAGLDTTHHGAYGFTDVRLIDASAMVGAFTFDAQITTNSINKYVNLVDSTGGALATADVAASNVVGKGANFLYTGGTNNDSMTVLIDNNVAASTTLTGQSDFTITLDGGAGNDTITTDIGGLETGAWLVDQKQNANITINGGLGNDTITTTGAGAVIINAGAGDDTVYTDNIGNKAKWAINDTALAISPDLMTAGNASSFLFGGKVTVSFSGAALGGGVTAAAADSASAAFTNGFEVTANITANADYTVTQFNINQAIKTAINLDPVLSKLLVAKDGPANTLTIDSLVDGTFNANDLSITVSNTAMTAADAAALTAYQAFVGNAAATLANANAAATATVTAANAVPGMSVNADGAGSILASSVGSNLNFAVAVTTQGVTAATESAVVTWGGFNGPGTETAGGQVITSALVTESAVATFGALTAGQTLSYGGITLTDAGGGTSAALVAAAFANLAAGAAANANAAYVAAGTLTGFSTGAAAGTAVTFTSAVASTNVADLVIGGTGAGATSQVITQGSNGVFTAAQVAQISGGGAAISGLTVTTPVAGWTVAAAVGATNVFTSTTANTNVTDIVIPAITGGGTLPTAVTTQGAAAVAEVFTLTVTGSADATGTETVAFAGHQTTGAIAVGSGTAEVVAAAIAGADTAVAGVYDVSALAGNVVTFTARAVGAVADAAAGNFTSNIVTTTTTGSRSSAESDNTINMGGATANDVLVLGTGAYSNDTLVVTGTALAKTTIVNFDSTAGTGTDSIDFTSYLTGKLGTAAASTRVATTLDANQILTANEVAVINFTAAGAQTFAAMTAANLLAAVNTTGNVAYGSIVDAALSANGPAAATLVGGVGHAVVLVQDTANLGTYAAFDLTFNAATPAADFTAATLIGTFDFGNTVAFATAGVLA